jgi:hypothetical protein
MKILLFNCAEPILIFVMMMNAVFYPNAISSVYLVLSLVLTVLSLKKD